MPDDKMLLEALHLAARNHCQALGLCIHKYVVLITISISGIA